MGMFVIAKKEVESYTNLSVFFKASLPNDVSSLILYQAWYSTTVSFSLKPNAILLLVDVP